MSRSSKPNLLQIEYALLALDEDAKTANHCLRAPELLNKLQKITAAGTYSPEIARFQIESQPPVPYTDSVESLLSVEKNMADRRATIKKHLAPNEFPLTISIHPRFGCAADTRAGLTTSTALTYPGQRYLTAQHNIAARRLHRADNSSPNPTPLLLLHHHVPLSPDTSTFAAPAGPPPSFITTAADGTPSITFAPTEPLLGLSHSCLQTTFAAPTLPAARALHDAFVPLAPILLALTAATPAHRGYLADTDARWNVVAAMSDDRDERERGAGVVRARYGGAERWVAWGAPGGCQPKAKADGEEAGEGVVQRLVGGGMDEVLARHYKGVLERPLLIYPVGCARKLGAAVALRRDSGADVAGGGCGEGGGDGEGSMGSPSPPPFAVRGDGGAGTDNGHHHARRRSRTTGKDRHENFECLTGAAYPSVKLKHPSPDDDDALGWRVELRSMENSLTDFENAAFVVFVALVRRAVDRSGSGGGGVNWYVPMEQVWENMERAHARDAVRWQRFWWKREGGEGGESALLTVDEIVNGCAAFDGGLMGLVERYMADEGFSVAEREKLQPYLDLVRGRASGRLCTTARFMRDFVTRHPEYARDSQVSEKVCFDLMQEVVRITNGKRDCGLFQSL
ncbi:Glutamate--cysteine ligase [Diplodia seriata]|uniref:Glutamate--cysteine ligase n=1 Tax=Diplodia seriata TaxID=420778 RepID=A0A1S8BC35_9PEZI|nr:Glutamate--cysteine ligase [Diplodia seriata]